LTKVLVCWRRAPAAGGGARFLLVEAKLGTGESSTRDRIRLDFKITWHVCHASVTNVWREEKSRAQKERKAREQGKQEQEDIDMHVVCYA
jgi:hypothetical protein